MHVLVLANNLITQMYKVINLLICFYDNPNKPIKVMGLAT